MTLNEFLADAKTTAAVEREITIMGEAASKLSVAFKQEHAEVPWTRLVRLRNFYVHAYERLDAEEVWGTANSLVHRVGRLVAGLIPVDEGQ
jgi:uncharacterized protein with HEPN domain